MKKSLIALLFLFSSTSFAQNYNINLLGQLDLVSIHNSDASDIWAYVDGSGNEYAIVGLNDGTSIVDISNPASPTEIFYEPGLNSIWRDMKTYNGYAYVTTEAQNGLLIIDLNSLPNVTGITASYYNGPTGDEWESAHNIYIDSSGIAYIFGANRGNGGCIMLDLNTNPTNPTEIGEVDDWYAHDGVAFNDTLMMGHINDGWMSIYDVSNPSSPVLLGTKTTAGNFSHNLWFSAYHDYVFTTDEISNGYIAAYDVSNPSNIFETDRIQSSPGMNVIPHNAHTIGNYLVTSYYRDGVTIHDVSDPYNLVEVGRYDSSPLDGDGFNGCWGAYPWLPSGNIIISDIEAGLLILGPTYVQGCYIDGNIKDANTLFNIPGADIELIGASLQDQSDLNGDYLTGHGVPGTYDLVYSKPGYYNDTVQNVNLVSGQTVTVDVQLTPIPSHDIVIEINNSGSGLSAADFEMTDGALSFNGQTNGAGFLSLNNVTEGTYDYFAGKWEYITSCSSIIVDGTQDTISIELLSGYYDDFTFDFSWSVTGTSTVGIWEIAEPAETNFGGGFGISNPGEDYQSDCSDQAYITGNNDASVGADDVDDGTMILTSPVMDLTSYNNPQIDLYYWWVNAGGGSTGNDQMYIMIDNGTEIDTVLSLDVNDVVQDWTALSFVISDYQTPSANQTLIVRTADDNPGHLVEAGLDYFIVSEGPVSIDENQLSIIDVYPNPSNGLVQLDKLPAGEKTILLLDAQGKLIQSYQTIAESYSLVIEGGSGIYFLRILGEEQINTHKIVKK